MWRTVDWSATAGTAALAASLALAPADVLSGFLPLTPAHAALLTPHIHNPVGTPFAAGFLDLIRLVGVSLIAYGFVAAVASVLSRFRHARGDERLQLKWYAYAGGLFVGALVVGALASAVLHGGVGSVLSGQGLLAALVPVRIAAIALPVAVAIAILRYRLYDIGLIINRTLVYVSLTAILAALYTASITSLQRVFISVSGQKSDTAVVLTAFVVVVAFSPVKDWLQKLVDRRLGGGSPAALLGRFRTEVEAVVSVLDVHQVACRLLDKAVAAFDARGAALYIYSSDLLDPFYSRGPPPDDLRSALYGVDPVYGVPAGD